MDKKRIIQYYFVAYEPNNIFLPYQYCYSTDPTLLKSVTNDRNHMEINEERTK